MLLIKKKIENWNGVEKIRLAKDFPAHTELKWNDILNKYYEKLITTKKEDFNDYDEFVKFYNHIVKELNIKTI